MKRGFAFIVSLLMAALCAGEVSCGCEGFCSKPVTVAEWAFANTQWASIVKSPQHTNNMSDLIWGNIRLHSLSYSSMCAKTRSVHHSHCAVPQHCVLCNADKMEEAKRLSLLYADIVNNKLDTAAFKRRASWLASDIAETGRAMADYTRAEVQDRLSDQQTVTIASTTVVKDGGSQTVNSVTSAQVVTGKDIKDLQEADALDRTAEEIQQVSRSLENQACELKNEAQSHFWFAFKAAAAGASLSHLQPGATMDFRTTEHIWRVNALKKTRLTQKSSGMPKLQVSCSGSF